MCCIIECSVLVVFSQREVENFFLSGLSNNIVEILWLWCTAVCGGTTVAVPSQSGTDGVTC